MSRPRQGRDFSILAAAPGAKENGPQPLKYQGLGFLMSDLKARPIIQECLVPFWFDLGNLWRRLVLPKRIDNWSLTNLQQRLVKTGGRLVTRVRYYWLLLAESHLTRRLLGSMLRRIAALPSPAG